MMHRDMSMYDERKTSRRSGGGLGNWMDDSCC